MAQTSGQQLKAFGLASVMVGQIVGATAGGYYLGQYLEVDKWISCGLAIAGFSLAMLSIYKLAAREGRKKED